MIVFLSISTEAFSLHEHRLHLLSAALNQAHSVLFTGVCLLWDNTMSLQQRPDWHNIYTLFVAAVILWVISNR